MIFLISYDIGSDRTRRRLAKRLRDYGPRVQKSVFEAGITLEEHQKLTKLLEETPLGKMDSIRLYSLCGSCIQKTQIWGKGEVSHDKPYVII